MDLHLYIILALVKRKNHSDFHSIWISIFMASNCLCDLYVPYGHNGLNIMQEEAKQRALIHFFFQAASPACTELETIVCDWLGKKDRRSAQVFSIGESSAMWFTRISSLNLEGRRPLARAFPLAILQSP